MYKHLFLLILFLFFFNEKNYSQDANDTLKTIDVFSPKKLKKTFADLSSVKVFFLEKNLESTTQSLDQYLQIHSSIFVKKLGVNSLSTLSFRGSSGAQTLVLWEGIPIQNSMNGATDVSLFQAGIFEKIDIEYDGNSSLYGSGNVGGALHLQSIFSNDNTTKIHSGIHVGSFGNISTYAKSFINNRNNSYYIKGFYQQGKNDFPYSYLSEKNRLSNAESSSYSILAGWENNSIFLNKKNKKNISGINFHVWLQQNSRGIPPAFFEPISSKLQDEFSLRNQFKFTHSFSSNQTVYIHSSWLYDIHEFSDSIAYYTQKIHTHQFYTEFGIKNQKQIQVKNWKVDYLFFLPFQYNELKNNVVSNVYHRQMSGIAGTMQASYKHQLFFQINARKEFSSDYTVPWLYGVKTAYHLPSISLINLQHRINAFFSYQNSFRAPLLHELYQFPGGNPNLKPEYGTNLEFGIKSLHFTNDFRYQLESQIVYFNRDVKDWIYWLGATIWTPYNIAEVNSKGWDIQVKNTFEIAPETYIYFHLDHSYVLSMTQKSFIANNNSIGKQIPYSPRYQTKGNIGFSMKDWIWNWNVGYTGYVFTNLDESLYLEPYFLSNTSLQFPIFSRKKYKLYSSIQVNNLFDTEYYTIQYRPMPGRNFQFSLHLRPL